MCGRFTLFTRAENVAAEFGLDTLFELQPRYNIAPSQNVLAIRSRSDANETVMLRWGLIPSWANDIKISYSLINARAETIATKPAFRAAYRKRRCLIPADGYFEWQAVGRKKQPFHIRRRDRGVFAFAGLWEHWEKDGHVIESCTIVTTTANELEPRLHERMPVILDRQGRALWLDSAIEDPQVLAALLRPCSAESMCCEPVNSVVNSPRYDGPECIGCPSAADTQPAPLEQRLDLFAADPGEIAGD
jgi:putative SOS response-associated peptidase YedK